MTRAGDHEGAAAPPAAPGWRRQAARLEPVLVGLVALGVGLLVRDGINDGVVPLAWNDSAEYQAAAGAPLLSVDRWLGSRTVALPLVLSAAGHDLVRLVDLQLQLAALAWAALAAAVAGALPGGGRRWLAAALVVGLSLTWPVAMWDQQVLTESVALSGLVGLVAAAVWALPHLTVPRAVALLATAAGWLAVRDGHVVPVALGGLAVLAWARWGRPGRRTLAALAGAYLVALALLVAGSAAYGGRDRLPLEHVYEVRVLPYPERVAWFAARGMPQAAEITHVLPPITAPGAAPWTYVPPDPHWAPWRRWLAEDGRAALLRYALAHPAYVVAETRHDPERVFNNAGGLRTYRPLALREVPVVDVLLFPSVPVAATLAALSGVLLVRRRVRSSSLAGVGLVVVATALPHALVVWHSDGMESARHLLVPGVQLRVGTLLLVLAAVLGPTAAPRPAGRIGP